MKHYLIDVQLRASVNIENQPRGYYKPDPNIKYALKSAKNQYLKELKAAAKELQKMIVEIERSDELQSVYYFSE